MHAQQLLDKAMEAFNASTSKNVTEFLAKYFAERTEGPFFLHISYQGETYLVDCGSCRNGTLQDLITFLESFLSAQLAEPVVIPELVSNARVKFGSMQYIVGQVLSPFDSLNCVSMTDFNKTQYALLETPAMCELSRDDYRDSLQKWVSVYAHKHGRVAIRLGVGRFTKKTLLFSADQLGAMTQSSTLGILLAENGEWFLKVEYDTPKLSRYALRIQIKSSTDKKASVWRVNLNTNTHGKLLFESLEHLVDPDTDEEEFINLREEYKLPRVIQKQGPLIDLTPPPTPQLHTSTGDSCIDISCETPKIICAQSMYSREGKFSFFATVANLTFVNNSADVLAVLNMTFEYQDANGDWKSFNNVKLGEPYQSWGNVSFQWQESLSFNMLEGSATTLGVEGCIEVEGEPGNDNMSRARIPKSLPQPLKLRVTLHDKEKKTKSLVVEKSNPPKDVSTKDSVEKSWGVQVCDFVSCDNANTDARIFVATYLAGLSPVIRLSKGSYYTWSSSHIKSLEYAAKEDEVTERKNTNMSWQNGDESGEITLLFDDKRDYLLYGLRISLTTATSSNTTVIPLPQANPEDYHIEVRTPAEKIVAGKPVCVFFEMKFPVSSSDKIVIGEESQKEHATKYISGAYTFNEKALQAGEVEVTPSTLEKGKKYVAKYIQYSSSEVVAWSKPFMAASE